MGAYPPGSTFKIVTTVAYLRANNGDETFDYDCNGKIDVDDYTIHCSSNKKHGNEDLLKAFSNSCNSAYAYMGLNMDRSVFSGTAEDLLFNTTLPTLLDSTKKSSFKVDSSTVDTIVAQTAIGQGNTTVSPIHMCMIVSAIANDGVLMEPYMADKLISADGQLVSQTEPVEYGQLLTSEEAKLLQSYMAAVVEEGTAEKVDFGDELTVYGKTGTAEYTDNKNITHSWFVGYAVDENGEKLAVAVIMESAGYGSKYAAPLAAKVFEDIGFNSIPRHDEKRTDIIQNIIFGEAEKLEEFCKTIQSLSPVNGYVTPIPEYIPGYEDKVIMAGGTFIEGSTIELSADGPMREPYAAYMQGGLNYAHVKICLEEMVKKL